MKPLEEELKSALVRQEAPAGFRGRLMGRIAAEPDRPWPRLRRLISLIGYPRLRWAAAATLALLTIAGVWAVRRQEDRRKVEFASSQVMFALRFAGSKLNLAMAHAEAIERKQASSESAMKSK
ncbi:MAG: hypothetical protein DMG21_13015 [Acidobacteria bacterium]|nr:MAG: hypothetical protein DMG21_13015 [Acidobacteriota bacterium]